MWNNWGPQKSKHRQKKKQNSEVLSTRSCADEKQHEEEVQVFIRPPVP